MAPAAKHRTIYQSILQDIRSGRYPVGKCLPTEHELAAQFGVARLTVLKALDLLKNEGLLTGVRGKGTFVARNAKAPEAERRQLGIVCLQLQDTFGHEVFLGFEGEALRNDYAVVAGNSNFDAALEAAHLKRIYEQGVAGVALIPFFQLNRALVQSLHEAGYPVVCVDNSYGIPGIPYLRTDNYQAAYDAVRLLINSGRRRIAFVTNTMEALEIVCTVRERYNGYRQALADCGIVFQHGWVQELGAALAARRPAEVGLDLYAYSPIHRLLHLPERPDAILLLWDELAPAAWNAIRNANLSIPDDIALIGFNDDDLCSLLNPALTSIRQPARELGALAARLLIDRIELRAVPEDAILHNQLIMRGSTRLMNPEPENVLYR